MQVSNVQLETRQIPPSPGAGSNPGNIRRDARRRNTVPRRKRQSVNTDTDQNPFHETTDEAFSKQYDATERYTNLRPNEINRVQREYANTNQEPNYQPGRMPLVRKKVEHKAKNSNLLLGRTKVTAINAWVGSWVIFWYFAIQLPFALMSIVGLAITLYIYNYIAEIPLGTEFITLAGQVIMLVGEGAIGVSRLISIATENFFGFAFDPIRLMIIPFAFVFLLGVLQLMLVWFIYSTTGIKSLSGEKGLKKKMLFLLAVVGSAFPIYPFILSWIRLVWKHPN